VHHHPENEYICVWIYADRGIIGYEGCHDRALAFNVEGGGRAMESIWSEITENATIIITESAGTAATTVYFPACSKCRLHSILGIWVQC